MPFYPPEHQPELQEVYEAELARQGKQGFYFHPGTGNSMIFIDESPDDAWQELAPYFLRDRFTDVPEGPEGDARRRLFYLTSHLETEGTPIEDWKFEVISTERDLEEEARTKPDEHDEVCADGDGKGCG